MRYPPPRARRALFLALAGLSVAAALARADATTAPGPQPIIYIGSVRDTAHYVPDSTILGRVGDRTFTVYDFRLGYFQNMAAEQPRLDSLGRAEFLQNMVRKEVLGQVALTAGYTLRPEERNELDDFQHMTILNRLYSTRVGQAVETPADSVEHLTRFFHYDQRMRLLFFRDRTEAEHIRQELISGTLPWTVAAARYAVHNAKGVDSKGEMDWMRFETLPIDLAARLWSLNPGAISPVILGQSGYQVVQVMQRRPRSAPEQRSLDRYVRIQLANLEHDARRRQMLHEAKSGLDLKYDTTLVRMAAARFGNAQSSTQQGLVTTFNIDESLPDFSESDQQRTLATWKPDGQITLGQLLSKYNEIAAMMRPSINTPDRLVDFADGVICEPELYTMAQKSGLARDSAVIAMVNRKREEILVTRMVDDSVFSKIKVSEADIRDYYDKHPADFTSFPTVRYAIIVRKTRAGADSVKAALDKGVSELAIVHQDSLAGNTRSGLVTLNSNEGSALHKLLFEEMRPGQSGVLGQDKSKNYACLKLISFDPGELIPYVKVKAPIDESVRNIKSEQALDAFAERLAGRFKISVRSEILMRIKPTTLTSDDM